MPNSTRTFIATQGPQGLTIDDFWSMIWQEHPEAIIMLTEVVESGKVSDLTKLCKHQSLIV